MSNNYLDNNERLIKSHANSDYEANVEFKEPKETKSDSKHKIIINLSN